MYIEGFCEMSSSNCRLNKLQCKNMKANAVDTCEKGGGNDKEKRNAITENDTKKFPAASTPVRKSTVRESAEEDTLSPVFMRFTQDNVDEDVDVVWDWDSPHSERHNRLLNKKRLQHSSPKIPRKQILFEKSKPKFQALKAQLEHLVSQVTEEKNSDGSDDCLFVDNDSMFLKPIAPEPSGACDLLDDDSFDEEMIKCSQRVEEDYNISKWCTSLVNNNQPLLHNTIEDDSFDVVLEDINEDELLSQASGSSENSSHNYLHQPALSTVASPRAISRTNSVPVDFLSSRQGAASKVSSPSFARTKSVELSVRSTAAAAVNFSQEEIERKRQEAKALLERRRKQNEIERKRQEALERLNKKRMQRMLNNVVAPIRR